MVFFPILIEILVRHFDSGYFLNQSEGLKNRNRILAAAPNIINFRAARVLDELMHESHNIIRVNIVSHLFAAVSENPVFFSFEIASDEVTKKPVEFDPGMIRTGQTAASEATRWYLKIAAVLLDHDIGGNFRRSKN